MWVAAHGFHPFKLLIALGIETLEAALVVSIFMHVEYSNRLLTLAVCARISWLVLPFGSTRADYLTRTSAQGRARCFSSSGAARCTRADRSS